MMNEMSGNCVGSEPCIDLDDLIAQLSPPHDHIQQSIGMEGTRTQLQSSNSNNLNKPNIGSVNLEGNFYGDVANKQVSQPLQHQQFQQQPLLRKDQQPYIRPSLLKSNLPCGHQNQHHQMPPPQFQSSSLSKLQHQMQLQSGSQSRPPGLQQPQHHRPLNQLNRFASSYPHPLGPQNHEFGSQRDMLQRHQMSATSLRPHSATTNGCQNTMEQPQPVVLNSSSVTGVANQAQNASLTDWYNEAYQQIQLMKETYLPQLFIVYKKARDSCLQNSLVQQSDGELATRAQKTRVMLENIIKFLQIARPKIVHYPREKLLNHIKMVQSHLSKIRNLVSVQSKTPQLQLNRNMGSQVNALAQGSTFTHIGSPPNSLANSFNLLQNCSLGAPNTRNHPSLSPHSSAGQQYTLSPQQTNEKASIQQRNWMPGGRPLKNEPQSTWSPPPKPNSSPRIFVGTSDNKMTTTLMTSPHSISSHRTMHPEKTNQSMPSRSSSLSNLPLISPSPSGPSTPPTGTAGPVKNPCAGNTQHTKTARETMEGSRQSPANEQPIQRLLNAVKSIPSAALAASCEDIGSVVSMIDEVPAGGTIFSIQFKNSANSGNKTRATPLDESSRLSYLQFDTESTATSNIKRPKIEASSNLLEEIKDINRKLVETTLEVDSNSADNVSTVGADDRTIVKCSYSGVGFANLFGLHQNSSPMLPNLFVRLLVPTEYPNSSPTVLDALPIGSSENPEDLAEKVKTTFSLSLRKLPQPMSLREMARTWDACARAVFKEFAEGMGGKSFSSSYGNWESCITAS